MMTVRMATVRVMMTVRVCPVSVMVIKRHDVVCPGVLELWWY